MCPLHHASVFAVFLAFVFVLEYCAVDKLFFTIIVFGWRTVTRSERLTALGCYNV